MKLITIIDAYIERDEQLRKLESFIDDIYSFGDIFLISNKSIDKKIQDKVKYFFYDSENILFQDTYDRYDDFYIWGIVDRFKLHTHYKHKQVHALSVYRNINNSLNIVKSLGYTHFQRIEYDMSIGPKTMETFRKNKQILEEKKSIFYLSDNNHLVFQYFLSDIDYFQKNLPKITTEEEYQNIIINEFGNKNYVVAEKFLGHFVKKLNREESYICQNFKKEMPDSVWNESYSNSHMNEHEVRCSTDVFKLNDEYVIFSNSKTDKILNRGVKIIYEDGTDEYFNREFRSKGHWTIDNIREKPKNMIIYDYDEKVYEKNFEEFYNYIEIIK